MVLPRHSFLFIDLCLILVEVLLAISNMSDDDMMYDEDDVMYDENYGDEDGGYDEDVAPCIGEKDISYHPKGMKYC